MTLPIRRFCFFLMLPACCAGAFAIEPTVVPSSGHAAPVPPPIAIRNPGSDPSPGSDSPSGTSAIRPRSATSGLTLYAIGDPTDEEQLYLEFINRARSDPSGEAIRFRTTTDSDVLREYDYFKVDLDLMALQFAGIAPAPPLAPNRELNTAAHRHSRDMLDNAFQGHTGSDGSNPGDRATDAGYAWTAIGENVFSYAVSPWHGHGAFEVDWGGDGTTGGMQDPPGHRDTIHNPIFKEVGISVLHGTNGPVGPRVVAQEFGSQGGTPRVTGVAYYDLNGNQFYDIGEAIGGVTVTAEGSNFYAVTAGSGGYALPVPGNGSYRVTFSLPGLTPITQTVQVANGDNTKIDFTPSYAPPRISGSTQTPLNQPRRFTFTPVAGATVYQWKSSRNIPASTDGAENGLANVIAVTSPGYDVIDAKVKARGKFAFHLAHAEKEDQLLEIDRLFRPGAESELVFFSRLGYASTGQIARAQVSTDGGLNWQDIWSQAGTGGPGETVFTPRAVSLASFAGEELRVRFVYEMPVGLYFNQTDPGVGFYLDDIGVTGAVELADTIVEEVSGANEFEFVPMAAGDYVLRVRAKVGNLYLPWGPAKLVGTDAVAEPEVTIVGIRPSIGDQVQIEFEGSGVGGEFALEMAATVNGPWAANAAASVEVIGANRYRATVTRPQGSVQFYRVRTR